MVQYYNLSKFNNNDGFIDYTTTLSSLTNYWYSYMLLFILFAILIIHGIRNGRDITKTIHLASFYTSVMSIFFYVSGIMPVSYVVFGLAVIYIGSSMFRWYHRD